MTKDLYNSYIQCDEATQAILLELNKNPPKVESSIEYTDAELVAATLRTAPGPARDVRAFTATGERTTEEPVSAPSVARTTEEVEDKLAALFAGMP